MVQEKETFPALFFEILNCNQENGNIIISILFLLLCLCRPVLQGVESGCGTRIETSRLTAQKACTTAVVYGKRRGSQKLRNRDCP